MACLLDVKVAEVSLATSLCTRRAGGQSNDVSIKTLNFQKRRQRSLISAPHLKSLGTSQFYVSDA